MDEKMILKERTYTNLIEASHAMAVEKGWWDGGIEARSLDDQFNNFHAEISEAWEEYRKGKMETYFTAFGAEFPVQQSGITAKPEGFWVEIADLLIRLADTCGAYGIVLGDYCSEAESDVSRIITLLHGSVVVIQNAMTGPRASRDIACLFAFCFLTASAHGVDLWAIIELKMSYNATRSHRHGGKRA